MVDKTWFFVHKYILLIQLHVMDNFCDEQASPLIFTYVAAGTEELALLSFKAHRTSISMDETN